MIPVISFISSSGMGKTTYLEKLIGEVKHRGYRIAVIKHDIHGFEMDHPGKDTWRHAQAGADIVCISSAEKFALIKKTQRDMDLAEIVPLITDVDFIFVEGYKNHSAMRVEIFRQTSGLAPLNRPDDLIAVISDTKLYEDLPHFALENPVVFADYLVRRLHEDWT